MKFDDAATFRGALEQRLEERAGGDRARLVQYRRQVVFDRLLARLTAVAKGQWALAGEVALDLRLSRGEKLRWQLELEWLSGYLSELRATMAEVASYDAGDFFEFELGTAGQGVTGRRVFNNFEVRASLAGSEFETVSLSVETRFAAISTETLCTDDLLGFAEIEPVEVEAVPLELQAAEKIYGYVSEYERVVKSRGTEDLLDLSMIAERSCLSSASLREAILKIFELHGMQLPGQLQRPPAEWAERFNNLAEAADTPDGIAAGHGAAAALLDPILGGKTSDGVWSAAQRQWITPSANEHPPSTQP